MNEVDLSYGHTNQLTLFSACGGLCEALMCEEQGIFDVARVDSAIKSTQIGTAHETSKQVDSGLRDEINKDTLSI